MDIFNFWEKSNKSEIFLFAEFQKAFDSVEWEFLLQSMRKFNFGKNFVKWMKILSTNPYFYIKNNGWIFPNWYVVLPVFNCLVFSCEKPCHTFYISCANELWIQYTFHFFTKWTPWRNKENLSDYCLKLRIFDPRHMGATFKTKTYYRCPRLHLKQFSLKKRKETKWMIQQNSVILPSEKTP